MSNWETKSNYSFEAANKLLLAELFNPSVHQSYYGCVQYVFHIMYAFFNDTKEKVQLGSKGEKEDVGTHIWLRRVIYKSIAANNKKAALMFRDEMADICGLRVQADYHFDLVEEDAAKKFNERAIKLVGFLKEYYDL